jgi:hypothetical protein
VIGRADARDEGQRHEMLDRNCRARLR